MSNSGKIWIVSELFYPEETSTAYILSKIADKLTMKYEVNVITSSQKYTNNITSNYKINSNVNIIHINTLKTNKNNIIERLFGQFITSFKLSFYLIKKISNSDSVLIVTNPVLLIIFVTLAKNFKRFNLSVLVHDVFPENTIPSGIIKSKSSFIYKFLILVYSYAYSKVDKIIVLGKDMKEIISKKIKKKSTKPSIEIIPNWGDHINILPMVSDVIKNRHKEKSITIQYAGNLGRAQGLDIFIDYLSNSTNMNLMFDIYGDGAHKKNLENKVSKLSLTNVNIYGSYSRDEQSNILNRTDISLVILSEGMYGLGVPSKTYNILCSGKPIIFIGDLNSEIALMIREYDFGFCFSSNDKEQIIKFLDNLSIKDIDRLNEMGKRSRWLAENFYTEEIILTKYLNIL